jgi:hypothetical protein
MNYGESGGLSASDVALLTGNTGNNGNGFGGENGCWWIILFLIFGLLGWNGNRGGFGGGFGGGNSGGAYDGYVLATDFATIERKLDGVNNGLCDGFYAVAQQFSNTNQNIANATASVQQTLCQGFSGVNQAIVANGYETRLGVNALSSQLANCCCDIRQQISDCCCTTQRGIDAVNYNMAMNTNSIQQTLCNNTRDIIESQNANYRALHDEIVANRIEDKNAQIAMQQNEINALRLAASQERQNNYLISQLKPCPDPAYIVPNPNCCYSYNVTSNNCGCNCGNF